jgi:hypothetical protein
MENKRNRTIRIKDPLKAPLLCATCQEYSVVECITCGELYCHECEGECKYDNKTETRYRQN